MYPCLSYTQKKSFVDINMHNSVNVHIVHPKCVSGYDVILHTLSVYVIDLLMPNSELDLLGASWNMSYLTVNIL